MRSTLFGSVLLVATLLGGSVSAQPSAPSLSHVTSQVSAPAPSKVPLLASRAPRASVAVRPLPSLGASASGAGGSGAGGTAKPATATKLAKPAKMFGGYIEDEPPAKPVLNPAFKPQKLIAGLQNGKAPFNKKLYDDVVAAGIDEHRAYIIAALATGPDWFSHPVMNELVFRQLFFNARPAGQDAEFGMNGIIAAAVVLQQQPDLVPMRTAFRRIYTGTFTLALLHDELLAGPPGEASAWSKTQSDKVTALMAQLSPLADAKVGLQGK